MRDPKTMSEAELREELVKIRGERSGIGRVRKKVAREKRIVGVQKQVRQRANAAAEEQADWV